MATKKITELPLINTISGSYSVVPIVIGDTVGTGNTDQISIENFSKFVTAYSAHTGSAGNIFTGPQTINNNVTINGRLTVTEVYAQYETASVIYSSGGNVFGDQNADLHQFTGSINLNGSLIYNGVLVTNVDANTINKLQQTTASLQQATQSLQSFTSSQLAVNLGNSIYTSSVDAHIVGISTYTSSVRDTLARVHQTTQSLQVATASLNQFTASQDSRNFIISQFTSSTNVHIVGISTFTSSQYDTMARVYQTTSSLQSTTASLNQFTASQDSRNLTLSIVTGSLIGITNGLMAFTASLDNTYATDAQLYQLYQSTASIQSFTASQDSRNFTLSTVTGSLIGITNGLMAFTAALDNTYATDAQLYQLYQATRSLELLSGSMIGVTNGLMAYTASNDSWKDGVRGEISKIEAWTASLDSTYATDAQLYQLYAETASIKAEIAGIEAYTASLKSVALVSGSLIASSSYSIVADGARTIDVFSAGIDFESYPLFSNVIAASGVAVSGDTNLRYNSSTNVLTVPTISATTYLGGVVSGSAQLTQLNTFTGSIQNEVSGIEVYTASLKAASIVSSSQQIQNYSLFATTGSNTFVGNQTINGTTKITGSLIVSGALTTNIISGGLDVFGGITGSLKGNVAGTATYSNLLNVGNSSTNQNYAIPFTTANSNGYMTLYTDLTGGPLYNPSTNKMELTGSLNVTGSITINSGSITMPDRPAFRVIGAGGAKQAPTVLSGSYLTVDYAQSNAWDNTTGTFTAPIAGLYQVNIVARCLNNASPAAQVIVYKNNTSLTPSPDGTALIMLEWAANTTANHIGGSTICKLAVGDTLKAIVASGTASFDANDNFSVAYIG